MRTLRIFLLSLVVLILGSGCIKSRMTIAVEPDGSGTMGIALGMTDEAQAMANTSDVDPLTNLSEAVAAEAVAEVSVRRWTEGEYDWVEVTRGFAELQEVNDVLSEGQLFESFVLTRHRGWVKDSFLLNGNIPPLIPEESADDLFMDPTAFFDMELSVTLPGEITSTNGEHAEGTNTLIWTIDNPPSDGLSAQSEIWKFRTKVLLVASFILLFLLGSTSVASLFMYLRTKE